MKRFPRVKGIETDWEGRLDIGDSFVGVVEDRILTTKFRAYLPLEYKRDGRKRSQIMNELLHIGLKGIRFTTADSYVPKFVRMKDILRTPKVQAKGEPKHVVFWDGRQRE